MEILITIAGVLLIALAIAQLTFWVASGLQQGLTEAKVLELHREMLQKEVQARATVEPKPVNPNTAWTGFRRFVVKQIVSETRNTTSVYLVPQDGLAIPTFRPGQHLTIQFQLPNQAKPLVRCYSLSAGPNPDYYRITVKAIPAPRDQADLPPGRISNFIHDGLQENMTVDIKAPNGDFYLDLDRESPVVLLAGGVGITPMLSMIETVLATNRKREILLLYGVQNGNDHLFKKRLKTLADSHNHFNVVNCYSSPTPEDISRKDCHVDGRVSVEILKRALPNNQFDFYMCGPGPFMESLYKDLLVWGVSENQIHFEAFGPASIKKSEIKKVVTEGTGTVAKIKFAKSETEVAWHDGYENILEAAEAAEVALDSGCRSGNCGTCQVGLLSGKVKYIAKPPSDIEPGTCLPCVAQPDGNVELDV